MKNNYEIKLVDKSVFLKVLNFLKNNLILSGYILPNIEHYGYKSSPFFKLYYSLDEKKQVVFVGGMYFDTMQIICFSEDACFAENLDSFITKNNIKRVTGNFEIIKQLSILKSGNVSMGSIFFLNNQHFLSPFEKYAAVKAVSYEEFIAIGGLLRKDESFYKNYKNDLVLGNQLYDRYKSKNGRSYYCCIGKEIVATASTYAESDSIAVISGIFTESKCKGKGIGTFLLSVLKNELINENKNIVIYFFDEKLTSFYERIGVYKKAICAKIEFFE